MLRTLPVPLFLSLFLVGLGNSGEVLAQTNRNYKLLGTYTKGTGFAGIAAFQDTKGGEYALLLDRLGTQVLDLRDPAKPKLLASFEGPKSSWRSACVVNGFGYVVSEGGPGVQILDLRVPTKAKFLGTVLRTSFGYAHSVVAEKVATNSKSPSSRIVILGTDTGSHLLSISPNPGLPKILGTWKGSYLLSGVLRGNLLYACAQWNGSLEIIDFSIPSKAKRSAAAKTSKKFPESIAISADESLAVVTDSHPQGGALSVFSLAKGAPPKLQSTWLPPDGKALGACVLIDRGVVQTGFLSQGLRMLDLGNPKQPKEIASFDPWKGNGNEFHGILSIARQAISNRVYALDVEKGLNIFDDPSGRSPYGVATVGWEEKAPLLSLHGAAWTGSSSFRIDLSNARPSSPAFFLLGAPGSVQLGELRVLIDPFKLPMILLQTQTGATGTLSQILKIPELPTLNGLTLGTQVLILDRLGANNFSASQGLRFRIIAP
jgi:hypothetical protein